MWAFWIHEDGTSEALAVDRPIETHRDGWLWLHLNLTDTRAAHWLAATDFPEPAIALLRSRSGHQQLHASGDCIYGVFSDLVRSLEKPTDEIAHLHFIMTERMLVSGVITRLVRPNPRVRKSPAALGACPRSRPCSNSLSSASSMPSTASPTISPRKSTRSRINC